MSIGITGINSAIGQALGKFGADGGTGGSSSGGGGGSGPTVSVRNVGSTTSVYEASAGSTIVMSGESAQTGIIYDVVVTAPINATIKAVRNISKLFQIGAGVYKPLIVIKEDPKINGASSGIGKALKAAKYQKNICNNKGMFLKNSI